MKRASDKVSRGMQEQGVMNIWAGGIHALARYIGGKTRH